MEDRSGIDLTFGRALRLIRDRSKAGQLTSWPQIEEELAGEGLLELQVEGAAGEWEDQLKRRMREQEDVEEIPGPDGLPRYFCSTYLTGAYATMLIERQRDPLALLVQTVRENSLLYPRPVPLHLFHNPPFGMSPEEIQRCLREMKDLESYQDIAQTTTSIDSVFLYSVAFVNWCNFQSP
jgi:hypothetical protein